MTPEPVDLGSTRVVQVGAMRRKPAGRLGDLQVAIMQILWTRQRATLAEIRTELERDRTIATTTIATVLARLERSGFITHRDGDRSRIYTPKVTRRQLQKTQARSLIDRLFGGRASELVAHLVRESEIDADELAELRRLLKDRQSS